MKQRKLIKEDQQYKGRIYMYLGLSRFYLYQGIKINEERSI